MTIAGAAIASDMNPKDQITQPFEGIVQEYERMKEGFIKRTCICSTGFSDGKRCKDGKRVYQ